MENLFNTQDYYAGQGSGGNQAFYTGQDYSMGHGSTPVEDDSLIKEGSKKCKTSETTSGSAQGGLNLNDEADGSGEEVREVKPIRRDRAKKKAFASSRFKYSSVAGGGLVNLVTDKWKSQVGWLRKNEGKTTILYRLYESGIGYLGKRESRGSGVEKTGT
nr:hypothetical protein [Tanacetum cinerariifolium]